MIRTRRERRRHFVRQKASVRLDINKGIEGSCKGQEMDDGLPKIQVKPAETNGNGDKASRQSSGIQSSNSSDQKISDTCDSGEEAFTPNKFQSWIINSQQSVGKFYEDHKKKLVIAFYIFLALAWHAYFIAAIVISRRNDALPLIIFTGLGWLYVLYYYFYTPYYKRFIDDTVCTPMLATVKPVFERKFVRWGICIVIVAGIIALIAYDTHKEPIRLVSLIGIAVFVFLGFILSTNTARVKWRPVLSGLLIQFVFSAVILRWPDGVTGFKWLAEKMVQFLDYTSNGTKFVYGFLANPPNICGMYPVLVFSVFQVIIFFGAVVNVLYYLGAMQFIMLRSAFIMGALMGTTAAESLVAVASTILGMTEAPLMIKPYMAKMTDSELHQIIVSGYASISGSLFAAYVGFGACSEYLLAASVMSCPGSLCMGKLFYPEVEKSKTKHVKDLKLESSGESSVIEALANGACSVVNIVFVIGANLVVFIAVIGFLNSVIGWLGTLVGIEGLTLELIYSYLFFPLVFVMGPSDHPEWQGKVNESMIVAELIGIKTFANEFIAYKQMGVYVAKGLLRPRAQMMATFALCGFANIGSVGIQIAALSGMCPEKKKVLPRLACRALLAGSLSCLMTACFAGLMVNVPLDCKPDSRASDCVDVSSGNFCRCTNETDFY